MSSRGIPVTKQMRLERRKFAEEAQAAYDLLSIEEKIKRLPEGGANRQRLRLLAQLDKKDRVVTVVPIEKKITK